MTAEAAESNFRLSADDFHEGFSIESTMLNGLDCRSTRFNLSN
jgi:hypothetical protein